MKTKYLDKRHWRRLEKKSYREIRLKEKKFDGIVGLLTMHQVRSPLQVEVVGECITVADVGYMWLQILPKGKSYSITAMFDPEGKPVQYYIDINEKNILEEGQARTQDLFLDVLVLPDGRYELVDEADLKRALKIRDITKKQYDFAYSTAHNMMHRIRDDFEGFQSEVEFCMKSICPGRWY